MGRRRKKSPLDSDDSLAGYFDVDFVRPARQGNRRRCRRCKAAWCKNRCDPRRVDVNSPSRIIARHNERRDDPTLTPVNQQVKEIQPILEAMVRPKRAVEASDEQRSNMWDIQLKPEHYTGESSCLRTEAEPKQEQVTIPSVYNRAVEDLGRQRKEPIPPSDEDVVSPADPIPADAEPKQPTTRPASPSRGWLASKSDPEKPNVEEKENFFGFVRRASSQLPKLFTNFSRSDSSPVAPANVDESRTGEAENQTNNRESVEMNAYNRCGPTAPDTHLEHRTCNGGNPWDFIRRTKDNTPTDELPRQPRSLRRSAENAFSRLRRASKLRKQPTIEDAEMYVSMALIKKHFGDYETAEKYFVKGIVLGRKCGVCKVWIADAKLALALLINLDDSRLVMAETLFNSVLKRYTECTDDDENGEVALSALIWNLERQEKPHAILEACAKYMHFFPYSFESTTPSVA